MQHLALGPSYLGLADLSSAYTCVQALETCSEKDVAAIRLSSRVSPSYQRLKQIADNRAMSEQMDATPQTETGTDDLSQVASQLVAGIALHFQESWI